MFFDAINYVFGTNYASREDAQKAINEMHAAIRTYDQSYQNYLEAVGRYHAKKDSVGTDCSDLVKKTIMENQIPMNSPMESILEKMKIIDDSYKLVPKIEIDTTGVEIPKAPTGKTIIVRGLLIPLALLGAACIVSVMHGMTGGTIVTHALAILGLGAKSGGGYGMVGGGITLFSSSLIGMLTGYFKENFEFASKCGETIVLANRRTNKAKVETAKVNKLARQANGRTKTLVEFYETTIKYTYEINKAEDMDDKVSILGSLVTKMASLICDIETN